MAKATVSLGGRDILDLDSLSVEEYELILKTAAEMKRIMKRDIKKVPSLRGKSIINLFYEPSTRTRTSFELAGKYLFQSGYHQRRRRCACTSFAGPFGYVHYP